MVAYGKCKCGLRPPMVILGMNWSCRDTAMCTVPVVPMDQSTVHGRCHQTLCPCRSNTMMLKALEGLSTTVIDLTNDTVRKSVPVLPHSLFNISALV